MHPWSPTHCLSLLMNHVVYSTLAHSSHLICQTWMCVFCETWTCSTMHVQLLSNNPGISPSFWCTPLLKNFYKQTPADNWHVLPKKMATLPAVCTLKCPSFKFGTPGGQRPLRNGPERPTAATSDVCTREWSLWRSRRHAVQIPRTRALNSGRRHNVGGECKRSLTLKNIGILSKLEISQIWLWYCLLALKKLCVAG